MKSIISHTLSNIYYWVYSTSKKTAQTLYARNLPWKNVKLTMMGFNTSQPLTIPSLTRHLV
ncbi:hypothetical protein H6F32_07870 [Anabaena sp. FACHB-1237]|uniref:hypothetical protein n=1 Tax=Anabaena sp. FACHB-1237 TaxID=2692769 RepID=UPI00167FE702|nr:hypothetical protein [Anabaena sp. FACHB-1237]MBD2137501.1 hypothetical protein [Anabaena sp. FACHB-1237]